MAPPTVTAIMARKTISAMGCRPLLGVYLDLESEALGLRRDCELVGGILEARLVVSRKFEVVRHEEGVEGTGIDTVVLDNPLPDKGMVVFHCNVHHLAVRDKRTAN